MITDEQLRNLPFTSKDFQSIRVGTWNLVEGCLVTSPPECDNPFTLYVQINLTSFAPEARRAVMSGVQAVLDNAEWQWKIAHPERNR